MTDISKNFNRVDYIDALRGIAAVIVVIQHSAERQIGLTSGPIHSFLELTFSGLVNFGRIGVVAFFAISGFVIPYSFRGPKPLVGFVAARAFRLYPAFWLSIALACLLSPILSQITISPAQIIANATMVPSLFGYNDIISVYWTLFIELVFYALCALIYCTGGFKKPNIAFYFMISFIVIGFVLALTGVLLGKNMPVGSPLFLATMFYGSVAREHFFKAHKEALHNFIVSTVLIVTIAPIATYLSFWSGERSGSALTATISYLLGVALFLSVCGWRMPNSRLLLWLGTISYSLYLFHPVIVEICELCARTFGIPPVWTIPTAVAAGALWAALMFRYVEKPCIKLGKTLVRRLTA